MVKGEASIQTAAFALAFLELAGAIGALATGSLSDKLGRKTALLILHAPRTLLSNLFSNTTY